ncbi:hypothetical protein G7Z17_g6420 [Cylindrodendrum hubeiense]|uniref:Uncharacterized protein n=1 Tax=Cylindrodendrum hubeiense TaxID=595255 RepID=A0A9P5L898_9HYPO|nr:hypothetical protein G7Z17_g6420 [Cylindrodendrum hubeiense]
MSDAATRSDFHRFTSPPTRTRIAVAEGGTRSVRIRAVMPLHPPGQDVDEVSGQQRLRKCVSRNGGIAVVPLSGHSWPATHNYERPSKALRSTQSKPRRNASSGFRPRSRPIAAPGIPFWALGEALSGRSPCLVAFSRLVWALGCACRLLQCPFGPKNGPLAFHSPRRRPGLHSLGILLSCPHDRTRPMHHAPCIAGRGQRTYGGHGGVDDDGGDNASRTGPAWTPAGGSSWRFPEPTD